MSVTKLIIVCDEKRMEMGSYLSQLLSSNDDTEDKTIGVKDGSVNCIVWAEKDFIDNAATVSSNQFVLFIGKSKVINEKTKHMKIVDSEHGIICKWLGKQAAITIDKVVPAKEYESFVEYAKKYVDSMDILISKKKKIEKGALGAGALGSMMLLTPIGVTAGVLGGTALAIRHMATNKKIEEQMFSCGVMKFYLEKISAFLGLEEAKSE